jgi:hypothetical protein
MWPKHFVIGTVSIPLILPVVCNLPRLSNYDATKASRRRGHRSSTYSVPCIQISGQLYCHAALTYLKFGICCGFLNCYSDRLYVSLDGRSDHRDVMENSRVIQSSMKHKSENITFGSHGSGKIVWTFMTYNSVTDYRLLSHILSLLVKEKKTISRVWFDSLVSIQATHAIVLTAIHFRCGLYSWVIAGNAACTAKRCIYPRHAVILLCS